MKKSDEVGTGIILQVLILAEHENGEDIKWAWEEKVGSAEISRANLEAQTKVKDNLNYSN